MEPPNPSHPSLVPESESESDSTAPAPSAPSAAAAAVSLARKWRPRNFADIVGQDYVVDAVRRAARRHHAYLFSGTRGVGKTTLARVLAMLLNCRDENAGDPCGKCPPCVAIRGGGFIDVVEIDAATHTQVDKMREALESAAYAPAQGRFRVFVIDEAHMLTRHSFNSMLKTLEEPPPHVRFILATTESQRVPATIRSRCLCFSLSPIPRKVITERLAFILREEKISFEPEALNEIARLGRGSLRDALSILDQVAHGGETLAARTVRQIVGASSIPLLGEILRAAGDNNPAEALRLSESLAAQNADFSEALQQAAALIFRAATLRAIPEISKNENGDGEEESVAREVAEKFSPEELQALYEIAIRGRAQIPFAPDERTGFEMTLLRMTLFSPQTVGTVPNPEPVPAASPAASPPPPPAKPERPASRALEKIDPQAARTMTWAELTKRVSETGRALAEHCREVSRDAGGVTVMLDRSRKSSEIFQGALAADLRKLCGEDFALRLEVGADDPVSEGRQKAAAAAAESDAFVRGVREKMPEATVEISPSDSGSAGDDADGGSDGTGGSGSGGSGETEAEKEGS